MKTCVIEYEFLFIESKNILKSCELFSQHFSNHICFVFDIKGINIIIIFHLNYISDFLSDRNP